jgi:hypothetical protein
MKPSTSSTPAFSNIIVICPRPNVPERNASHNSSIVSTLKPAKISLICCGVANSSKHSSHVSVALPPFVAFPAFVIIMVLLLLLLIIHEVSLSLDPS